MSPFVRMEHPETGGVWDAPLDYAPIARKRGWVESDKPLPGEESEDYGDVVTADFDPAKRTAAEVNDYLDSLPEEDTERARVLDAERGGKNRTTITGATEPTQPEGVATHG